LHEEHFSNTCILVKAANYLETFTASVVDVDAPAAAGVCCLPVPRSLKADAFPVVFRPNLKTVQGQVHIII